MVMRTQCELCNNYDNVHAADCPIRILQRIQNGDHHVQGPVKCFNGAFDGRTQRTHDFQDVVMAAIKKREPDACCTYFPAPGYTMVHKFGSEISGECRTKAQALEEAFFKLYPEYADGR